MSDFEFIWFAMYVLNYVAGGLLYGVVRDRAWRRNAVREGHAEWVIKGHRKVWRWKEIK